MVADRSAFSCLRMTSVTPFFLFVLVVFVIGSLMLAALLWSAKRGDPMTERRFPPPRRRHRRLLQQIFAATAFLPGAFLGGI
jgi:hypothetical protein